MGKQLKKRDRRLRDRQSAFSPGEGKVKPGSGNRHKSAPRDKKAKD